MATPTNAPSAFAGTGSRTYSNYTIFGGSGFIGRYAVRALARTGAPIRVAVRRPDSAAALSLKPMGDVGQIALVPANVRDDASIARALDGAEAVVNLVGILSEGGKQRFSALHQDGAARIARTARAGGAKALVHISAIGADPAAASAYGRSKAAGEAAVRDAFPDAVILRPSVVFGPEDDFFNRFAWLARISPALPLIAGETKFQPVYVGDVAAAITAALGRAACAGHTFELGGPQIYSFREILELVLKHIGRRRLLIPVPNPIAEVMAMVLQYLPNPILTRDQLRALRTDNVVADGAAGLADLGITPAGCEGILPRYLGRYRRGGALQAI